jgi:acetoin utilization protein AcuB
MFIRDIMTTDVITIPSDTGVLEAKRIMDQKNLKRIPVVDGGKLVGIVTSSRLERATPPEPETLSKSMWDIAYSIVALHHMPVKQIMQTEVATAAPDMTVEEALALAQSKKVGGLVVVEDSKVVGIVTTNDVFYRIVNPVLGVGDPGERIWVAGGGEGKAMEEIISTINKLRLEIITLHIMTAPRSIKKDIVVHINSDDVSELVAELKAKGYKIESRKR